MSAEGTIEKEWMLVDLASFTKAESIEKVENTENTTNLTEQLAADFKILKTFTSVQYVSCSILPVKVIKIFEERLDRYFYTINNLKDPKLEDVIVLASCFILMTCIDNSVKSDLPQENTYLSELHLIRSMALLKEKELNNKTILETMCNFYELGRLYKKLKNPKKSLYCLNKALELYFLYTKGEDEFPVPIDAVTVTGFYGNLFELNTVHLLDRVYLSTLSILIRSSDDFEYGLIDTEKIATYMHKLLMKLLKTVPSSINHNAWALEAIQLAEFFLCCNCFIECKDHLCAASVMMMKYYNDMYVKCKAETSSKEKDYVSLKFKNVVSIIDMIWVKYGLIILYLSRKRLLHKEEKDRPREIVKSELKSIIQSNRKRMKLIFTDVKEEFTKFIHVMPDNYITDYSDAKILFIRILNLLHNVKTHALASVSAEFRTEIAHYTSKAYKYLASYEHDKIKQIKLQKRRIDVLEDCLKTLSVTDNLNHCIFIWFELAVINSTILGIRIENIHNKKLTTEELAEINLLVKNSVHYFQLYLDQSKPIDTQVDSYRIMSHFNLRYKKTLRYVTLIE
ncbi:PREDICTED: KIF1-binding protein homolog isoform X1 [Dinoponera quadriceps]|uniref:KIF-binding protein n=1 Tax=Dinoponera quadriceps TaxID=609295 RepID=A0A6P3WNE8_DINQU|nr:PREDICTED: KIF1-binding protein homolog isoform X1 [Dinoponera quadriceps]XP_014467362.1 PREDICTED: KIF1-binding protein homolog isoform X1 [Dinoponera quadriceps]XP_014467363.1 PREDICTED: KIF1-binding protein homolog isoform X1 [Dinoponera quadriceps]